MSDVAIIVGYAGKMKQGRGFVPTELRDMLADFEYVTRGPLICGGQFINATIPAEHFDELKEELAPNYTVVRKEEKSSPSQTQLSP